MTYEVQRPETILISAIASGQDSLLTDAEQEDLHTTVAAVKKEVP